MSPIIVLLHNTSVLELEVKIFIQDFLVEIRTYGFIKYFQSSRSNAAPDHHTTTTMSTVGEMFFLGNAVSFTSDVTTHNTKFNFCLVSLQNMCPKVLRIISMYWKLFCSLGNLCTPATPGKIQHCFRFSLFVDSECHCVSLETQSLKMAL